MFLAGHREVHPYPRITTYHSTISVRILKTGLKSWTSCPPCTALAVQVCISPLDSHQAPSNGCRHGVSLPPCAAGGARRRHEASALHRVRLPTGGGPPGFRFFDMCGSISHIALSWSCVHTVSALVTPAHVLAFLLSLWRPAVISELMHILPLAQLRPTP